MRAAGRAARSPFPRGDSRRVAEFPHRGVENGPLGSAPAGVRERAALAAALLQRAPADLEQRAAALAQGLRPLRTLAVEQLRRGADRVAEGAVVGVPPEVAGEAGLPGVVLDVGALVEAEFGVRAADAGVLDATPGALAGAVAEGVVVDPDHSRFDPAGDPLALLAVPGPNRGAEAELGVVGEFDRLLLAVDRDDRQDRTEDLLAHDPHLVADAGEDGRCDEPARHPGDLGRAAAELGGAGGDRVVDQFGDDPVLAGGGHRPDFGLPLERVADPHPRRLAGDALDEAVGDLAHDVDALDTRAGLAGVGEAAPDRAGHGVVEVGVGADDHRVLAAELEHRALQLAGADLADRAPDLDRAGAEDLAGARPGQRVADRAAAVNDPDQALGQAAVLEDVADPLAQQRRQAGRLEHDAVAGHQRDRDLAEGDRPGVVPGGDDADHADRLVGEVAALGEREGLRHPHLLVGEDLRPRLGAPVQGVDRRQQLHRVRLGARLALLADQQLG